MKTQELVTKNGEVNPFTKPKEAPFILGPAKTLEKTRGNHKG